MPPEEGARIAAAFYGAVAGDAGALGALLAEDAVLRSDGGSACQSPVNRSAHASGGHYVRRSGQASRSRRPHACAPPGLKAEVATVSGMSAKKNIL